MPRLGIGFRARGLGLGVSRLRVYGLGCIFLGSRGLGVQGFKFEGSRSGVFARAVRADLRALAPRRANFAEILIFLHILGLVLECHILSNGSIPP